MVKIIKSNTDTHRHIKVVIHIMIIYQSKKKKKPKKFFEKKMSSFYQVSLDFLIQKRKKKFKNQLQIDRFSYPKIQYIRIFPLPNKFSINGKYQN